MLQLRNSIELVFMTIDGRKVRLSALNKVRRDEIDILRCSISGGGEKDFRGEYYGMADEVEKE